MKKGVASGLVVAGLVLGVCFVWFSNQHSNRETTAMPDMPETEARNNSSRTSTGTTEAVTPILEDVNHETSNPSSAHTPEPITFTVTTLPEGQQRVLRTLGITEDIITVTPAMETCVTGELGTDRLAEILTGDTPSFFEGAVLINCYHQ
jgi:hypothetical protein